MGFSHQRQEYYTIYETTLLTLSKNSITPILSIPTGGTMETCIAAKKMFDGGVFVNPFVPPGVPEGHSLIRTSFMSSHTPALVEEAADVIAKALKC